MFKRKKQQQKPRAYIGEDETDREFELVVQYFYKGF